VNVLVTGGTGFVGSEIVHALRAEGRGVRALVRRPQSAIRLASWGVELVVGDVTDAASVRAAADGCTHVVHLVAIIRGRPEDFRRVMVDGFRNVLDAARAAGVERVVLMSALGTGEETKDRVPYFGAKWEMEHDLAGSGLEGVVFRPSFVFGRRGGALPTFVRQVRYSPVVTVIGSGRQRSQPIWLDDVAAYVARGLDRPDAAGRTFELGGPDTVDWNELYRRIAAALGKRRRLVHVPAGIARGGARLTEWIPGAPLSADQVTMIEGPDVVVSNDDATATFGLPLVSLDDQLRRAVG
jgi:NADH dehydrogenase